MLTFRPRGPKQGKSSVLLTTRGVSSGVPRRPELAVTVDDGLGFAGTPAMSVPVTPLPGFPGRRAHGSGHAAFDLRRSGTGGRSRGAVHAPGVVSTVPRGAVQSEPGRKVGFRGGFPLGRTAPGRDGSPDRMVPPRRPGSRLPVADAGTPGDDSALSTKQPHPSRAGSDRMA